MTFVVAVMVVFADDESPKGLVAKTTKRKDVSATMLMLENGIERIDDEDPEIEKGQLIPYFSTGATILQVHK